MNIASQQIFTSFEQHVYNIYEALKKLFGSFFNDLQELLCFTLLSSFTYEDKWAMNALVIKKFTYEAAWKHGPTNIKLFWSALQYLSTYFKFKTTRICSWHTVWKWPQKSAVLGAKIQIIVLILWRIFQLSNFVRRSNSWKIRRLYFETKTKM